MKYSLLVVSVVLFVGCKSTEISATDFSQNAASDSSTAAQTVSSRNRDMVRCESVRRTGTRVRTRVCRTVREWERIHNESLESIRRAESGANVVHSTDT